jgi:hypothetical protein
VILSKSSDDSIDSVPKLRRFHQSVSVAAMLLPRLEHQSVGCGCSFADFGHFSFDPIL